jgi:hydroxymethylpyrimidine kinase/phosphomethylpyrimidine kinase
MAADRRRPFSPDPPRILSIAGSDPSGGAGIQADLKTFSSLGCYGLSVLTSLTAQNTCGVSQIHIPPVDFFKAQLKALWEDVELDAIKIGMLGNRDVILALAEELQHNVRQSELNTNFIKDQIC